jgi:2-oxo-hept-3-ene-1,7-dioate hydratase
VLTDLQRSQAADILAHAHRSRIQATQLSVTYPQLTIDDAYAISTTLAERRIANGATMIGHKVGLTSRAMQASSRIAEPDYGHLFDDMLLADGAQVSFDDYCRPRVELELAFTLAAPLPGPRVGLLDVLRATEFVVPSIEIIDARVMEPRQITDTVADNGAAASVVLGGRPSKPSEVDLRWIGGVMYRNGQIEETGMAAGVLGHPARAVAWLANRLAGFGTVLQAGQLVLAGSFIRPVFADRGDTLHADFGPLGAVAVRFH